MTDEQLKRLARQTAKLSAMALNEAVGTAGIPPNTLKIWVKDDSKLIYPIILSALRKVRESEGKNG